jgi:hypothetical protein
MISEAKLEPLVLRKTCCIGCFIRWAILGLARRNYIFERVAINYPSVI